MFTRALRLFHTVRYLKPIQITGRVAARLRRLRPDLRPAPPLRPPVQPWSTTLWRPPGRIAPDRFRFLNVERTVSTSADWNAPDAARLWLYTLHYLHDLHCVFDVRNSSNVHDVHDVHCVFPVHFSPDVHGVHSVFANDAAAGADLIDRWIAANPPVSGAGWEPYCLSLRIVNWITFASTGAGLSQQATHSLAVQVRALADQVEVHLLGNHLFANGKALIFAGACFHGPEANRWLERGASILQAELAEQVLADGGHFERSPMYHHIILGDVLDLLRLDRMAPDRLPADLVDLLREAAPRMLGWAATMTHQDGGLALFNDAAFGIAPPLSILIEDAGALGVEQPLPPCRLSWMKASGYVRAEAGPAVLIADVGEVGPDYLPGHAHADTLSCEVSLKGRRLIVNGGTSTYVGTERLRERGTAAHSTVVVDGENSSEVWSSFRVARRARPLDVGVRDVGSSIVIEASHDGYRRLPGRVDHHRRWDLTEAGLTVTDTLTGTVRTAEAVWHLHPDVVVVPHGGGFRLEQSGRTVAHVGFEGGHAVLEPGSWSPEFGLSVPNLHLRVRFDGPVLVTRFDWRRP